MLLNTQTVKYKVSGYRHLPPFRYINMSEVFQFYSKQHTYFNSGPNWLLKGFFVMT